MYTASQIYTTVRTPPIKSTVITRTPITQVAALTSKPTNPTDNSSSIIKPDLPNTPRGLIPLIQNLRLNITEKEIPLDEITYLA